MQYIKGIQRTSLIDYPGQIATVIFFGGCNLRCQFCHNPELVLHPNETQTISEEKIWTFLDTRIGKIDAVVITGGEPCLDKNIISFIKKIKTKGFLVKLDTNGTRPEILKETLPYIDYIAMDIKSDLKHYNLISGINLNLELIKESVNIIRNSGKDYEFRTTVVKKYFNEKIFFNICYWLKGSRRYVLQQFDKRNPLINESLKEEKLYSKEDMVWFKAKATPYFENVELRNI